MTDHMTLVQARVTKEDARRLDADVRTLGLSSRSEAIREGLQLLHRRARQSALVRDYDEFYGVGVEAPMSDLAAIGHHIAVDELGARTSG